MGILLAVIVLMTILYIFGRGPRKAVAEAIVKTEDAGHAAAKVAKATPAKLNQAKVTGTKAVVAGVSIGGAVTKVAVEKGSKVGAATGSKVSEFVQEAGYSVRGFVGDVAKERQTILSNRRKTARANRVANSQKAQAKETIVPEVLAISEKSTC